VRRTEIRKAQNAGIPNPALEGRGNEIKEEGNAMNAIKILTAKRAAKEFIKRADTWK